MQPIQEFNNKIKMGTFSIFALVLTFILVFYYAVVIFMDLRKINPEARKDDVEFIKTAEEQETQHEEEDQPVDVDEDNFLHPISHEVNDSLPVSDQPHDEGTSMTAEDVKNMETSEVYERICNAKNEMITYRADAEHEMTSEEFRQHMIEGEMLLDQMSESLANMSL